MLVATVFNTHIVLQNKYFHNNWTVCSKCTRAGPLFLAFSTNIETCAERR